MHYIQPPQQDPIVLPLVKYYPNRAFDFIFIFFLHMPLILLPAPDQIRIDCCVAELAQTEGPEQRYSVIVFLRPRLGDYSGD